MNRSQRKSIIEKIEKARGSKLLTYICSTRSGLSYEMDQIVDIRYLYDHLKEIGKVKKT